ncbi:hypothetical protein G7Z17_g4764 [Cylindrodendrum hubeiense]|uniref:Uncharacterized protein n=1 Tax=Cylindrodendrum hubeiense TaxID=595255 RepID=A0A9P5HDB6_9HYPO|nr:hypothetical protein G7Z17_g4764 [Cylindrodendrum hubeiense]
MAGEDRETFTLYSCKREDRSRLRGLLQRCLLDDMVDAITEDFLSDPETKVAGSDIYVLLVLISMDLGVVMSPSHITATREICWESTISFFYLQVLTACDLYQNDGTPWVFIGAEDSETTAARQGAESDSMLETDLGLSSGSPEAQTELPADPLSTFDQLVREDQDDVVGEPMVFQFDDAELAEDESEGEMPWWALF